MITSSLSYSQVGINTTNPQKTLDIEGTLRLSETVALNKPGAVSTNSLPLYGDITNGTVVYSPKGFTKVTGGYRPGSSYQIAVLPVTNTIARFRFVVHVDNSNNTNNSDSAAYAYGDFTVLGTGAANPIKFVDITLKGFDGGPKGFAVNSDNTTISWDNNSQGTITITLNQTTGIMTISGAALNVFSYFFEVLGGT